MLLFSESLPLDCEPPGGSEFFVISALEIVTAYSREGEREEGRNAMKPGMTDTFGFFSLS